VLITDIVTIAPSKIEVVMIPEAVWKILLLTERRQLKLIKMGVGVYDEKVQ
jgi:hypothetical protein